MVPSQPHTGLKSGGHSSGRRAQTPAASTSHAPTSPLQNLPAEQVRPEPLPQAKVGSHGPSFLIVTPAASAMQALEYVVSLQPQTGARMAGQLAGIGWQTPAASAAHSPSGREQNSPVPHVAPPVPPHACSSPAQTPVCATPTLAASAKQALS